jgi:hypothetical protein
LLRREHLTRPFCGRRSTIGVLPAGPMGCGFGR